MTLIECKTLFGNFLLLFKTYNQEPPAEGSMLVHSLSIGVSDIHRKIFPPISEAEKRKVLLTLPSAVINGHKYKWKWKYKYNCLGFSSTLGPRRACACPKKIKNKIKYGHKTRRQEKTKWWWKCILVSKFHF